jgi:hypothetical protein
MLDFTSLDPWVATLSSINSFVGVTEWVVIAVYWSPVSRLYFSYAPTLLSLLRSDVPAFLRPV